MPSNINDLIAANQGKANIKAAHDALGVASGGDSWYNFYAAAVGHGGSLADLMYEYWTSPSGITYMPYQKGMPAWAWESTTGGTWTRVAAGGGIDGGYAQSSAAQNDSASYTMTLDAGTYSFFLVHWTSTNRGIYTVNIGGTDVGTIDGYSAGSVANVISSLTGISVATQGSYAVKLTMATKNASSAGYVAIVNSLAMVRTS